MRYRRFGRTGWEVSEMGYGMWGMAGWTNSNDDESLQSLQAAVDRDCLAERLHRLGMAAHPQVLFAGEIGPERGEAVGRDRRDAEARQRLP